jgi:hypothetical protein
MYPYCFGISPKQIIIATGQKDRDRHVIFSMIYKRISSNECGKAKNKPTRIYDDFGDYGIGFATLPPTLMVNLHTYHILPSPKSNGF